MPLKSVVWKCVKDGKCQVSENEKICCEPVNKEHSGSVWRHFERFHRKFYDQLKAEEKEEEPAQPKIDAFVNPKSGPLKDLALLFSTSTIPTSTLKNDRFKVSFGVDLFRVGIVLGVCGTHSEFQVTVG